ncbi:hypothetical protein V2H45_12615 [Tumidithrix elongata RA019]|uniref:Uncharacterized protein n=1 Tax=Tumidithrix elongata BACA0141 TaxID=2716417 RepID=A0AAW9Q196_9CYAN|nr:hypothetical protein [Tumidithrix elongata RA019]
MTSPKRFDMQTFLVRFGCGFLIGGLAVGFGTIGFFSGSLLPGFLIGGIICGLLAWHLGDRFWENFRSWIGWL